MQPGIIKWPLSEGFYSPDIRFGKPCVKGTRISVYDVLSWLVADMPIEDILDDFPQFKRMDILACLAYSADKNGKVKVI